MSADAKGADETDWSHGGIPAVLQASTETSLKFACLVRFTEAGNASRKEILDAVLYLVIGALTSCLTVHRSHTKVLNVDGCTVPSSKTSV